MNTQIKCPHCNKLFEPTDAYKHELEERLLREAQLKHQKEVEQLKLEKEEISKSKKEEIENVKIQAAEKAKKEAQEGVAKELKDKESQISELKKRAEQAEEQELKIRKEKRDLEGAKRKFELEKQRQLDEERDKIRENALKEAQEKHELKDKEKAEQLRAALKANEELRRKLQQGSQQTQGEALELELEEILKREFPLDNITEVKKGQRGADVTQEVIDKRGRNCGTILWELKNARWQNTWINKLKEDQRQAKAHLAILVVAEPPENIKTYVYNKGIWITTRKMIVPLALTLRFNLVNLYHKQQASIGKNQKMETLYQYITSVEFSHRIEAILETFGEFQEGIEKEKRLSQIKWAKQEKQLRKMIDHTAGMYGDLQGVVGKSLPEITTLQLDSGKD
ncbi:MAG: DUF2130 domain-containing protein [Candidatus Shapirobacteria bacterium]